MKSICLVLNFFLFFVGCYSQDTTTLFLDNNFMKVDKSVAIIERTAIKTNNHYYITDKFLSGKMINYVEFLIGNPLIEDGLSINYDEFGQMYSKGNYIDGKLSGEWVYYKNNKPDTVDYSMADSYLRSPESSCQEDYKSIAQKLPKDELEGLKNNIIEFVQQNWHVPARLRNENSDTELNFNVIIDTDGKIKCPELINSLHIDYYYEALRLLLLYKTDSIIDMPLKINFSFKWLNQDLNIDDAAFWICEQSATFRGGDINKFISWVQANIIYPEEAVKANIQGRIFVQFAVNSEGYVVDVKIARGANPALDKEAIRCIESSPRWSPGKQGGVPIKQIFVLPVNFQLNSNGKPMLYN